MSYLFSIYNIMGFKLCWWACVLGAVSDKAYLGPAMVSLYIFIHLYSISSKSRMLELYLLLFAGIFGTLVDTIFLNLNLLTYAGSYSNVNYIAPLWITAMWVGFTATLNHAFKKIIKKYYIQIILGLIFGPLAYITGNELDAIIFNPEYSQNLILIIIALAWGCAFPLLCWLSNKIKVI
jgi:hypothetical protein